MFTPSVREAPTHSLSTRNPRRRQRAPSEEHGVSLPRAKRQRSALSSETYVKPRERPEPLHDVTLTMNGHASRETIRVPSVDSAHIPIRGPKKGIERGSKGDGSVILTKNSQYAVSKLPGLPDSIRNNPAERSHGSVFPDIGFAIAMTATHALVWPYATAASSPETFTIILPHPSKHAYDPLPLGTLVASSSTAASEPGLVVVMPTSGKITYWESITNAATLNLMRQQRVGVEGLVGSLMSGERVVSIENAEPAGMVLALSSGRIALLSIRDGQGRPALTSTFMKSNFTSSGSGLFGSIRHAFGGGWRRDVASIRAGLARRGERTIAVATTRGLVQIWEVHRGGHHVLQAEVDARASILTALTGRQSQKSDKIEEPLEVLDIAFGPGPPDSQELAHVEDPRPTHLLMLVARKEAKSSPYALVAVSINERTVTTTLVHAITCYAKGLAEQAATRARLYFPQPYQTAFVVFETALVITNVVHTQGSPEHQLLSDSQGLRPSFEDVVDFRDGLDLTIVGGGAEDGRDVDHQVVEDGLPHRRRSRDPGCVLLVQNSGLLRVTASKPLTDLRKIEASGVQSKIEQAINYGAESLNPINFVVSPSSKFSSEEIEEAALRISRGILSSESKAITLVTPSMEQSLKQRSAAVRQLATYLRETFAPLRREVKWRLLWDAEMLAAARSVWNLYDARLKEVVMAEREQDMLSQIVRMMHESFSRQADESAGEVDQIRQWFTRDVGNIWLLVTWAWNGIKEVQSYEHQDRNTTARMIAEANEIQNGALRTAFQFRQENLELYGLGQEMIESGLMKRGYEGLPEFWTSGNHLVEGVRELTEFSRDFVLFQRSQLDTQDSPDAGIVEKIRKANVESVELCGKVWEERFRWKHAQEDGRASGQDRDRIDRDLKTMRLAFLAMRRDQVLGLGQLELHEEAIKLAERYQDMSALVSLIAQEYTRIVLLQAQLDGTEANDELGRVLDDREDRLKRRIDGYFTTFGQEWANAYFVELLRGSNTANLMLEGDDQPLFLTQFLKSNAAYAKLGWICDVLLLDDYGSAGQILSQHAHVQENDQWSKKVELSMAKLACLAAHPAEAAEAEAKRLSWVDDELELVSIQDQLYDHIAPVTANRIDAEAGVTIAMREFGRGLKDKPALRSLLEQHLGELLAQNSLGVRRLVDTLTLIDAHFDAENAEDLRGREFILALQANRYDRDDGKSDVAIREKIIWRRCMLRDDWTAINDTNLQDDQALERATARTALFHTLKAGFASDLDKPTPCFRPIRPSEILGVGTSASDLRLHLPEDLRKMVAHDISKEDTKLKTYIDKGRLEAWFDGIVEAAKKALADEQEAKSIEARALKEMEEQMTNALHLTNGHGHGHGHHDVHEHTNGHTEPDGDGAEDSDVDMA